jgi:holo-[acyl-carrier protein] synthase
MTGTDIIEISRIEKAVKSQRFYDKVYTESEKSYISSKKLPVQTAAGIFCAKEAAAKALGTGFSDGVKFHDIEITHDEAGKPFIKFYGRAAEIFKEKNYKETGISVSHCKLYAVAFCVLI